MEEYRSDLFDDETEDILMDFIFDAKLLSRRTGVSITDALLAMNLMKGTDVENQTLNLNYKLKHIKELLNDEF